MGKLFRRTLQYTIGSIIIIFLLSFNIARIDDNNKVSDAANKSNSKFFSNKNITDGPYIFYENNEIIVKWIVKDRLFEKTISNNNFNIIKRKFGFDFNPDWIKANNYDSLNFNQNYKNVKNFIAISDIHGQHDVFVKLLRNYKIIDTECNWIFGTGHLVVLGDILDRGSKVTESLWLVVKLEQQAKEQGGKIHFLLGNHELMVLNNDLRYVNEKYITSAELMGTTYNQLFSDSTFLGRWLRKKPVIITINDFLFVHAGISPELIQHEYTIEKINSLFFNEIIEKHEYTVLPDSCRKLLTSSKGPVWYRGYFTDKGLKESQINDILQYFKSNHIIVGHTSFPNIISLFDNKIIGIDASIKKGEYGEVLIYKNKKIFKGALDGNITKL